MWIRSQDKTKLLKVEIVEYFSGLGVYVNGQRCAKYSTEQKALKVLDMIHKYINTGYVEKNKNNSEEYSISRTYGNVIIMPQDDEV